MEDTLVEAPDMTGRVFGRLTVIRRVDYIQKRGARYVCGCECGNLTDVAGVELRKGRVRSCGCLSRQLLVERSTKHGHTIGHNRSPEYTAWTNMLDRCYNCNSEYYHRYGGRGIEVCASWRESFENFLTDMGTKPSPKHSIERVSNDRGYEKANCKWATKGEQSRNRCTTNWITHDGETRCLTDWAVVKGIGVDTLWRRLKAGWTAERALTQPVRGKD